MFATLLHIIHVVSYLTIQSFISRKWQVLAWESLRKPFWLSLWANWNFTRIFARENTFQSGKITVFQPESAQRTQPSAVLHGSWICLWLTLLWRKTWGMYLFSAVANLQPAVVSWLLSEVEGSLKSVTEGSWGLASPVLRQCAQKV